MAKFRGYELLISPNKNTLEIAKKLISYGGECSSVEKYITCSECFARVNPDGGCIFHIKTEEKGTMSYHNYKIKLAKEYIAKFEVTFVQEELEI